jgi:hypothetical protein
MQGLCECGCGNKTKINIQNNRYHGHVKGQPRRFILGHNSKGSNHPGWKNGESTSHGRKTLSRKNRLGEDKIGFVFEHRVICEKALGKKLPPKAVIHHHSITQLVICQNNGYHMLLHQRTRAFRVCGFASWRKCRFCQQYDSPEKLK